MTTAEFAGLSEGELRADPEVTIRGFATDSRDVKPGDLFIAIRGQKVDGRDFIGAAISAGAVAVLTDSPVESPSILVGSIESGLAKFGRNVRARFSGPVLGVTGSAGKTTTKEFLAAALATEGEVLKSQGNKNTEYTSPLLWANLTAETRFAVVEMAMRGFGQIAHLAEIAKPTLGIITNIGYSHLLQVGSRLGIARAKGELLESLPSDGVAVLWREDDFFAELGEMAKGRRIATFGFAPDADCQVASYAPVSWSKAVVTGTCQGVPWQATLPAVGRHIALDAAAAILAASLVGVEPQKSASAIEGVTLPGMRMEIRDRNGATVLLDTYNASPPSMLAAIESVCETAASGRRLAILGQMLELGEATEAAHRTVGEAIAHSNFDRVLFVGDSMRFAHEEVGDPSKSKIAESDAELKSLVDGLRPGDVLLVKGSRALELERILA